MLVKASREPNGEVHGEFGLGSNIDSDKLDNNVQKSDRQSDRWGAVRDVAGFIRDRFDDALKYQDKAFPGDIEEKRAQSAQKSARAVFKAISDFAGRKSKEAVEARIMRDIERAGRDGADRGPSERGEMNDRVERADRLSRTC